MPSSPLPTLRERKKARTRDALAETALALFRRRGFDAATVEEIAAEVEVSRRTFFRYFPTKEAAAFPRHAEEIAQFRRLLEEHRDDAHPFSAVRRAGLALAAYYVRDRHTLLEQARVVDSSPALLAYERELDLEWEAAVAEALTPRVGAQPADVRRAAIVAGAAIGAFRATLRQWFAGDAREDLVRLGQQTLDLLERGVIPPKRSSSGR